MRRKRNRISVVIPALVCLGLAAGALFLLTRYLQVNRERQQLQEQLSESETRAEELETQVENLNAETERLTKEAEETAAALEAAKAEAEAAAAAVTPENLEETPAGTILEESQISWDNLGAYFAAYEISDALFARIYGDNASYKTYCTISREELRYVKVLHYNYDHQIQVGELIVNAALTDDFTQIFLELFQNGYEIEKMHLIDDYSADDDASVNDNNTSCFNYRMTPLGDSLSNHSAGRAIDINPKQNPYFIMDASGQFQCDNTDAELYRDRSVANASELHMITHDDLCYQIFLQHGFTWGGDWTGPIDYQHFEKL